MNPVILFLNDELKKRQAKNQRYTKRAFAKTLGLEPSALAKILKGERIPTLSTFHRIQEKLGVVSTAIPEVTAWIETVNSSEKYFAPYDKESIEKVIGISHLFILEALRVPHFSNSLKSLQQAMGLSSEEFYRIITDLEKLNMLAYEKQADRVKILKFHNTTLPIAPTTQKLRAMQKSFLELALQALEKLPIEKRHNSTLTLAIPSSKLEFFKTEMAKFRRKLVIEAEKDIQDSDSVYNFTFAVYPVIPQSPR